MYWTLTRKETITPGCLRLFFKGDDLARFDDIGQLHGRLLMQPHGVQHPEWPMLDDDGHIVWPDADRPLNTRLFTIRRVEPDTGLLVIDAVRHAGEGRAPARIWLQSAEPGAIAAILGPAAHGLLPAIHHVLAGDETGLPAIARMLEAMPNTAHGVALIETASADDVQTLVKPAGVDVRWLLRGTAPAGTTTLLEDAIRSLAWPPDLQEVFCWVGCEYDAYRRIKRHLDERVGLPAHRQVTFAFWRRGMSEEEIVAAGADSVTA